MLLTSWNLNSIRAREERLLAWLECRRPDVVCLQELKCTADQFPFEAIEAAGYQAAIHGQKTYNGVAILAKSDLEDVSTGFGDGGDDSQARVIAATIDGARIISVYVVNGKQIDSEKYAHKLEWLDRLERYLAAQDLGASLAICGDYNIVPDERDVEKHEIWQGGVLYNEDLSARFKRLLDLGLVDTFRTHHDEAGIYSWWDYRMLGFPKNNGLRIDHILATPPLAERSTDAWVDRDERKGKKPSDHAPVLTEFRD
ncbi:MAG: exodeoxyribonuclease III [Acidobacteria bacterium]|nr:exodeoxyribonuclease III [Acidobacteriota bacterium]